jgi:sulfotransferase
MPRSGSTLLASLLNQNPDVFVSSSSPVCNLLWHTHELWESQVALHANPNNDAKRRVLGNLIGDFYADRKESLVIDKSFTWGTPENLNLLMQYAPDLPRFIVMDRPADEVEASFRRLMSKYPNSMFEPADELRSGIIARCERSRNHLLSFVPELCVVVSYDALVSSPQSIIKSVYAHFGMSNFAHDFDNIAGTSTDNDAVWGLPTMHDVRPTIRKAHYV